MADQFQLDIATPERVVVHDHVTEAQIPCVSGYIGVLPGHAALISELGEGELTYTSTTEGKKTIRVNGGYVEILDDVARVLANEYSEA